MAARPNTIELLVTLHVSKEAQKTLEERAAASGMEFAEYISAIVEQATHGKLSLEALSGTVFQRFLQSGVTDEQLSDELEKAKHEQRAERRARRAS